MATGGMVIADYNVHYEHNAEGCRGDVTVRAELMDTWRLVSFLAIGVRCDVCGPCPVVGTTPAPDGIAELEPGVSTEEDPAVHEQGGGYAPPHCDTNRDRED